MLIDTRTKSRAYGRHSAFAPFFASTWLHSLPYAEVSKNMRDTTEIDHSIAQTTLISIIYPVGPAAIILMPLIIGGLIDSFGFSEQQAGAIASAEGIGLVLALLVASFWVRKVAWRTGLLLGLALYAALNLSSSFVSGHAQILTLRFLSGYLGGSVFAIVVAALGDNREPDRAFGIAQAVQGLLMGVLFVMAPPLMGRAGVNALFYMMALLALLCIPALLKFPRHGLVGAHAENLVSVRQSAPIALSVGLLGGFLYYLAVFGFWGFIERVGLQAGLAPDTIGLALGAAQIAAVIGALTAAAAAQRLGRVVPLLTALLGQAAVLWLLVGQFSSNAFYIGAFLWQGLYVMATAYQLGVIAALDNKGKFIVIMTALQGLGAALGPSIAAALAQPSDYSALNWASAIAMVLSLGTFVLLAARGHHTGKSA